MRYRKRARENSLLVLYRWDISGEPPERVLKDVVEEKGIKNKEVLEFMEELVRTVVSRITDIDALIAEHLENWSFDRIGYIERNLLRLGVAELVFMSAKDPGRVFNDYVDLAKKYADKKAAAFVNGVLSSIYRKFATSSTRG
jgi:N utilization substance protein B